MADPPRDPSLDSTLAFLADPYRFVSERCDRFGSDVFAARLMLRPMLFLRGPEAAELFYDPDLFTREGAAPGRIQKTLFGRGGVQALDGEAHRVRKAMFMSLMSSERVDGLTRIADGLWDAAVDRWASMGRVALYDEMRELLTRAVCRWAGVPLPEDEVVRRTEELTALFDQAGSVGPGHWWSRLSRRRADRWGAGAVQDVREGRLTPPADSAAAVIAAHREPDGSALSPRVAGVELMNILRPTVAVSVYVTFVAHALHRHPGLRPDPGDGAAVEAFVEEVRRFYPFFPSLIAVTRHEIEWKGYRLAEGRRTVLDLYGTNHDARTWAAPEEFRPDRFPVRRACPFGFVPQGGGDHHLHHRCPGEAITVALMKLAVRRLTGGLRYDVPEQDLEIDFGRLPALPRDRFVMREVRRA